MVYFMCCLFNSVLYFYIDLFVVNGCCWMCGMFILYFYFVSADIGLNVATLVMLVLLLLDLHKSYKNQRVWPF